MGAILLELGSAAGTTLPELRERGRAVARSKGWRPLAASTATSALRVNQRLKGGSYEL